MEPIKTEIVVLGAGPGGYAAAFHAADLGKKVILVEQDKGLGGVCLNRGCIPSKALLYATKMLVDARESAHRGLLFDPPKIDLDKMRLWKDSVVAKLNQGVAGMAQRRGVQVIRGRGYFENSNQLRVETDQGQQFIGYEKMILAVGSKPALPRMFDLGNPRVMTSTEALQIEEIPSDLLIVGGGYIGMELGTVYSNLGSRVVVIEAGESILAGADADLVRPVIKYAEKNFKELRYQAKVTKMATKGKKISVISERDGKSAEELFDRVLISVGRVPNAEDLGLENTRIEKDDRGFVKVNEKMETNDPSIYAIGDIAGGVLLAHKAAREARIAVENIAGNETINRDIIIPAVVFTDPEIAWCGLTEGDAKARGIAVQIAKFPWGASGRALTYDRTDGLTKLVLEPETDRILGVGIVGHGAGELISEGVLAVEMGANARDLADTVHPHPTLSETVMEAAELFYGHSSHAYLRKTPTS